MSYRAYFDQEHSEQFNKIINKNNIDLFDIDDISVFLYLFPLIERLIVEILDISTLVNIECKEQGKIRTVNSLIQQDETRVILGNDLIEKISKYFNESGIRNKMMHYNPNENTIKSTLEDINEVKEIAICLCKIYEKELKKYDSIVIDKIDLVCME